MEQLYQEPPTGSWNILEKKVAGMQEQEDGEESCEKPSSGYDMAGYDMKSQQLWPPTRSSQPKSYHKCIEDLQVSPLSEGMCLVALELSSAPDLAFYREPIVIFTSESSRLLLRVLLYRWAKSIQTVYLPSIPLPNSETSLLLAAVASLSLTYSEHPCAHLAPYPGLIFPSLHPFASKPLTWGTARPLCLDLLRVPLSQLLRNRASTKQLSNTPAPGVSPQFFQLCLKTQPMNLLFAHLEASIALQ